MKELLNTSFKNFMPNFVIYYIFYVFIFFVMLLNDQLGIYRKYYMNILKFYRILGVGKLERKYFFKN